MLSRAATRLPCRTSSDRTLRMVQRFESLPRSRLLPGMTSPAWVTKAQALRLETIIGVPIFADVTSQETFPATLGSNCSNALAAAASSPAWSSMVTSGRERRPRFRRWLVIWVRVEATEEEIASITQAARKLGLTPSQFVTRAAASLRSKQKSQRAADRGHPSLGKTKLPLRKRKS